MPRKKRSASPIDFDDYPFDCEDELSSNGSKGNASNPPIQRNAANARERARMRVLSSAFCRLKTKLPWVPADTKLSKLDTLRLATIYIQQLRASLLSNDRENDQFMAEGAPTAAPSLVWPFTFSNQIDIARAPAISSATAGLSQWLTNSTRSSNSNNDRQQLTRISYLNNSTAHG